MAKLTLSDKAVVISIGEGISSFITFISGMLLVRLVTKEGYGIYTQVLLIYSILAPVFSMSIPTSVYFFMPRLSDDKKAIFAWQTIGISLFLGLISGIILYATAGIFSNGFHNPAVKPLLNVYFLFPLFNFPFNCLFALLIVANRHIGAAIIKLLFIFLIESLSVLLPLALGYDLSIVFKLRVLFSVISFPIVLLYTYKVYSLSSGLNIKLLLSQLKYSVPLGLSSIAGHITQRLDRTVVSMFFSVTSFAIYSRGAFEIPFIGILSESVMTVIMPVLSKFHEEGKYREFLKLWHDSIRKVASLLYPIFAFLFIVANDFIVLLYSENYAESTTPFRIYLFTLLSKITVYGNVLLALGLSHLILVGSILTLIISLLLNIIAINIFGFYGPALAYLLSIYALILFYLFKVKKTLKVGFIQIFPWASLAKIIMVSCIGAVPTYLITLLALPRILKILSAGVVFSVVYIPLAFKLDIMCKDDINLLKRWYGILGFSSIAFSMKRLLMASRRS